MYKRILSLLLCISLSLGIYGCGKNTTTETTKSEEESHEDLLYDDPAPFHGSREGKVYTNELFGFQITLDSSFSFYNDTKIMEHNGVTSFGGQVQLLEEGLEQFIEENSSWIDVQAFSLNGWNDNITFNVISDAENVYSDIDIAYFLKMRESVERKSISDIGGTTKSYEVLTMDFLGEDRPCASVSYTYDDHDIQTYQFFLTAEGYAGFIRITDFDKSAGDQMFGFFSLLDGAESRQKETKANGTQTDEIQINSVYSSYDVENRNLLIEAENWYYGINGFEKDEQKAAELYEIGMSKGSPLSMYMYSLASAKSDASKAFELLDSAEAAAYLLGDDPEARLVLGICARIHTEYDSAISYLEGVADTEEPYGTNAMLELGESYQRKEDYNSAAEWYEKAYDAGCIRALNKLGENALYTQDYDSAIYWYEKAVEEGDADWSGLGKSYELAGRYDEAMQAYATGYEEEGGSTYYGYPIGRLYYINAGNHSEYGREALECFKIYLDGRTITDPEHFSDQNEEHIKEFVQDMLDKGRVDQGMVDEILGEGFLDS